MPGSDGIRGLIGARRCAKKISQDRSQVSQGGTCWSPHSRQPIATAALLNLKPRQHAGADQRRLTRTRLSVHNDQVFPCEAVDDRVDYLLTAEEDLVLIGLEWPQAGVGLVRQGNL